MLLAILLLAIVLKAGVCLEVKNGFATIATEKNLPIFAITSSYIQPI